MKKTSLLILGTLLTAQIQAQSINDLIKQGQKIINGQTGNNNTNQQNGTGNLSNNDIVSGLREALRIGTQNASQNLNKRNGFFGNQLIKILLPPEVSQVETALRKYGFNRQCDNLIMTLNRAAEDAAGKAAPIFVNAITQMSITDGLSILRGGNNAATEFLKRSTSSALTQAFRPVIDQSLAKTGATKAWRDVFAIYNKLPITANKVNTDLTGYVTEKALNGMFVSVAQEEANIRQNPSARVNDILQKVFGGR